MNRIIQKKRRPALLLAVLLIICSSIYCWHSQRRNGRIPVWFSTDSGYMTDEDTFDEQRIISTFKKHESVFDQLLHMYFHDKNEYSPFYIHYCSTRTGLFEKRSYYREIYERVEDSPLLSESEHIKIIDGYMSKIVLDNRNKIELNERKNMDYLMDQGLTCSDMLDIYMRLSDDPCGAETEPQIKIHIYADKAQEIYIIYQPNFEFEIYEGLNSGEEYYQLKKVIRLDKDWYFLYKEANESIDILP